MSISSIALIAALAIVPSAQDAEPRVETRSEIRIVTTGGDGPGRLDADEDSFVTREEFIAPLANAFDRLDADDDGRLSEEELRSHHADGEDHDGPVILNMLRGQPRFRMFGGHGSGPGDVMMFHGGPDGGEREVFIMRRGGPGGDMEWSGPGRGRVEIRRFGGPGGHGDMDANDDGRVTEDEFIASMREAFRRMDTDRDGALGGREDAETGGDD